MDGEREREHEREREPALRKRAGDVQVVVADVENAKNTMERDVVLDRYRALSEYHRNVFWMQLAFMVVLWIVLGLFIWFHETPSVLLLRKILFAYFFMPVFTVVTLVYYFTRNIHELNDFVGRIALVCIGFGSAYIVLSVFNTVLLALDMSERV